MARKANYISDMRPQDSLMPVADRLETLERMLISGSAKPFPESVDSH
jgi:hypothetical protein